MNPVESVTGEAAGRPMIDDKLLEMGLALTPGQRLKWLEETVKELLPWLGLAAQAESESLKS